jgi:hypothetical protein
MADKLSDLLAAERVRGIWRRQLVDPVVSGKAPVAGSTVTEAVGREVLASAELGAARIAREAPSQVLRMLHSELRAQLGARYVLLGYLLHPLSTAIERVQGGGVAAALHPLARAADDSVPRLLNRLDDALTAMLRIERRARAQLERLW